MISGKKVWIDRSKEKKPVDFFSLSILKVLYKIEGNVGGCSPGDIIVKIKIPGRFNALVIG